MSLPVFLSLLKLSKGDFPVILHYLPHNRCFSLAISTQILNGTDSKIKHVAFCCNNLDTTGDLVVEILTLLSDLLVFSLNICFKTSQTTCSNLPFAEH